MYIETFHNIILYIFYNAFKSLQLHTCKSAYTHKMSLSVDHLLGRTLVKPVLRCVCQALTVSAPEQ